MSGSDDEIIAAGSRRIVGRAALRRLGGMVRQWQTEEEAKSALAKRFGFGLAIAALLAVGLFIWFYR